MKKTIQLTPARHALKRGEVAAGSKLSSTPHAAEEHVSVRSLPPLQFVGRAPIELRRQMEAAQSLERRIDYIKGEDFLVVPMGGMNPRLPGSAPGGTGRWKPVWQLLGASSDRIGVTWVARRAAELSGSGNPLVPNLCSFYLDGTFTLDILNKQNGVPTTYYTRLEVESNADDSVLRFPEKLTVRIGNASYGAEFNVVTIAGRARRAWVRQSFGFDAQATRIIIGWGIRSRDEQSLEMAAKSKASLVLTISQWEPFF